MKGIKKVLISALALLTIGIGVIGFSSCDKGNDGDIGSFQEELENSLKFVGEQYLGGYNVVGIGTYQSSDVIIPSTYNGLPVIKIVDEAFKDCVSITSVSIGENVISIGERAFEGCSGLEEIAIPNSVTKIGSGAFCDCTSLEELEIPNSVTGELSNLCIGCTNLKHVVIGDGVASLGWNMFQGCSNLKELKLGDSVEEIGGNLFSNCNIEKLTLGKGLKNIYQMAFRDGGITLEEVYYTGDIESWVKIQFPVNPLCYTEKFYINNQLIKEMVINTNEVMNIGENSFFGYNGLEKLVINGYTNIGKHAFENCRNLKSIKIIGNGNASIESCAFAGCNNLTDVFIGGVKELKSECFLLSNNIQNCTFDEGVEYIDWDIFEEDCNLKNITIASTVKQIDGVLARFETFSDEVIKFGNLENVYYNGKIEDWCKITFENFNSAETVTSNPLALGVNWYIEDQLIENLVIPNTVKEIKKQAFFGANINSAIIGDNVEYVGGEAFMNCSHLIDLTIGKRVKTIGEYTFFCSNVSSSVGGMSFVVGNNIKNVYYKGDIGDWCGIVFEGYWSNPLDYVSEYAEGYENPIKLYIGNDLLTELVIPDNIKEIKYHAFGHNDALTKVVFSDCTVSIGEKAFQDCSYLSIIDFGLNLEIIGAHAFEGCYSLKSIVLGENLASIGEEAFNWCTNLKSITFNGTVEQWNAIEKGDNWNRGVPATEVVCIDGTVKL
ncbi:MAG: leucine-rich repeat domain-containing protein [Clostridiales bacterium]|nr:leucine-rich repeat domain-containing protein [Clostridiales bacterium]